MSLKNGMSKVSVKFTFPMSGSQEIRQGCMILWTNQKWLARVCTNNVAPKMFVNGLSTNSSVRTIISFYHEDLEKQEGCGLRPVSK